MFWNNNKNKYWLSITIDNLPGEPGAPKKPTPQRDGTFEQEFAKGAGKAIAGLISVQPIRPFISAVMQMQADEIVIVTGS